MARLPIYNRTGDEVGKYEVDPEQLAPRISKQLLHDAVVMYQNNLRQGSVKTKTRSEVSGTTKKMYRQKGTGNARAGSRQQRHPPRRRTHPRPAAARLVVPPAEKGPPHRHANGLGFAHRRQRDHADRQPEFCAAEDPRDGRRA